MNLSGILVICQPAAIDMLIDSLNSMQGLEVHHVDRETNRLIVVQEAETIHDEVAGLKAIKKLPDIVLAEMIYHYFEDGADLTSTELPEDLDKYTGIPSSAVPAYLNE